MQDTINAPGKLSRMNLVSLVNELSYTPNPEDPDPAPWPWRYIINKAMDRVVTGLSTHSSLLSRVALNPQPLPPKAYFAMILAHEVIGQAAMMHQMGSAFNQNGEERGIIIVSGFINSFVDDICPTPPRIKIPRLGWPFPPEPDPHPEWSGLELAIIGTQFQNEARMSSDKGIRKALSTAADKLLDVASSRFNKKENGVLAKT